MSTVKLYYVIEEFIFIQSFKEDDKIKNKKRFTTLYIEVFPIF